MNNQKHVQELSSERTEFKREIGVFGGVSIIGGIMIGSGIFYLGSYVLQRTNYNYGLAIFSLGSRRNNISIRWIMLCRIRSSYA